MNAKRSQSGITFLGFLFVLIILGFFAYMAMTLVPIYSEYMGVSKSADDLAKQPGAAEKQIDDIRRDIMFKFSLQYVGDDSIKPQQIRVVPVNGIKTLDIAYERRAHFISNIDFVVAFHKTAILSHAANP
jgi:hypothetical protein